MSVHLLTKPEVAERLRISIRQLEVYMKAGAFAVHRFGRRCVRIDQAEVDRFAKRFRS